MRPIDSLIPKPSEISSNRSATTTLPSKPLAPISQRTGAPGSKTISTTTAPARGRGPTDPADTLKALQAQLPPGIQSSLKPDYGPTGTFKGYLITGKHSPAAVEKAKELLAQSLMPMDGETCLNLLTELKALTRPSQGTTADLEAQMVAYLKRLMDYPADVVRYVLVTQPEFSPWWPAWSELKDRLELHSYRRRAMMATITASFPSA